MFQGKAFYPKDNWKDVSHRLAERLAEHLTLKHVPKGKKLPLRNKGEGFCYVVMQGIIIVNRVNDGLMLAAFDSPGIFGVGHFMLPNNTVILEAYTPCSVGVLTSDEFEELITQEGLWQPLSLHLTNVINLLFSITTSISHPGSYDKIRTQLLILDNEPDEIKSNFTVANYIGRKTLLSRSGIMRILSDLRQGGYIEVKDGYLLKVNKLPEKY